MVIKHYIALFFTLIALSSAAGKGSTSFADGNDAFKKKQFDVAAKAFEAEIDAHPRNASAYFNLGLTYNAQKKFGKAIWAFERVLKLKPNDAESIDNIEQNYTELNNSQKWNSNLSRFERTAYSYSSDSWAYLSIFFSVLAGLLFFLFRKSKSLSRKRAFIVGAILNLVLLTFSIYIASSANSFETSSNQIIVTKKNIDTFKKGSKASQNDTTGVHLEEGTKLELTERSKGSIFKVTSSDNTSHYVRSIDVDII